MGDMIFIRTQMDEYFRKTKMIMHEGAHTQEQRDGEFMDYIIDVFHWSPEFLAKVRERSDPHTFIASRMVEYLMMPEHAQLPAGVSKNEFKDNLKRAHVAAKIFLTQTEKEKAKQQTFLNIEFKVTIGKGEGGKKEVRIFAVKKMQMDTPQTLECRQRIDRTSGKIWTYINMKGSSSKQQQ